MEEARVVKKPEIEKPVVNIVDPSTGKKFRVYEKKQIPYTVLEVTPSKLTANNNVKYLMMEFSKFFIPFDKRIHLQGMKVVVTPELTFWWEVVLTRGKIKFYMVIPNKDEFTKEALKRKIRTIWSKSNVKEINDYIPEFVPEKTDVCLMTLEKNPILSLDTLDTMGSQQHNSPLEQWLNAKMYLEQNDFAMLQIGMKPEGNGWNTNAKDLLEVVKRDGHLPRKKGKKLSGKEVIQGIVFGIGIVIEELMNLIGSFFIPKWEDDKGLSEMTKTRVGDLTIATKRKVDMDAFRTNIRIVVQSDEAERRKSIIRAISGGFRALEGPNSNNRLIEQPISKLKEKIKELNRVTRRKMTKGIRDVLCTGELASIVNVPDMKAQREHYNELALVGHRGEADVPQEIFNPKSGIMIATYEDTDGKRKPVYLPWNKDYMCRPIVAMGGQGAGKTTFACNVALDAFSQGYGVCLVDAADGRMIQRILDRIKPEQRDKVKVIDFVNEEWAVGLGLNEAFRGGGRHVVDLVAEEIATYIETISQTKINMTARGWLELAVRAVFTSPDATIDDVIMMLKEPSYREKVLPTIKDPELRADWERFHTQYSKQERRNVYEQIFRRVHKLLRNETIKCVIRQRPKKDADGNYLVDFRKWMDEGYLVLVKADEALDRPQQNALISFVIAKYNLAMMSRRDIPSEDDRHPAFLILDEPDHYIKGSDRWEFMLTTYRKYRGVLCFMFHTWEQLKKKVKNLPDYVRSAGSHYILMNNDEKRNFEYLRHAIEPEFRIDEIAKGMPEYHAIIRLKMGGVVPAFMGKTPEEPEKRFKYYNNNDLLEKCAQELGRPMQEVMQEVFSASNGGEFDIGEVTTGGLVDEDDRIIPIYEDDEYEEEVEEEDTEVDVEYAEHEILERIRRARTYRED